MYIYSEGLKKRMQEIAVQVKERTKGIVSYEEFIAIPYFGNIILRFTLETEQYDIDDLDHYEELIYDIVGDEFLVDFMGSVYRKVGVDFSNQEAQYAKMAEKYENERVISSIHAAGICEDAKTLLEKAGIDSSKDVWEIQVDDNELALMILGEKAKKIKEISDPINLYVGEVNQTSCTGLIKATFYAKRNHISVARILLES